MLIVPLEKESRHVRDDCLQLRVQIEDAWYYEVQQTEVAHGGQANEDRLFHRRLIK